MVISNLQRVIDPSSPIFRPSVDIILQSIPASEQLDEPRLLRLLERDDYRLYSFGFDEQVAGAAMLYLPQGERFAWLDYMAVRSDLRGRGLGAELFLALVAVVSRERPAADHLLLEVDDDRRIMFYRRLGARLLVNVNYLFPSHQGSPLPMRLMIRRLHDGVDLSREALRSAIEAIFTGIHGRAKDDRLLRSILDALPSDLIVG